MDFDKFVRITVTVYPLIFMNEASLTPVHTDSASLD